MDTLSLTITYVELQCLCLGIILCLLFSTILYNKRKEEYVSNYIIGVFVSCALIVASDCSWMLFESFTKTNTTLLYAVNIIFFVFECIGVMFWFMYAAETGGSRLSKNKWVLFASVFPFVIFVIFIVTTPIHKLIFFIDEFGKYQRGYLNPSAAVFNCTYLLITSIMAIVRAVNSTDKEKIRNNIILSLYPVPILICGLIQQLYNASFLCIGFVIALLAEYAVLIKHSDDELLVLQNTFTNDFDGVFVIDVDNDKIRTLRIRDSYSDQFLRDESEPKYSERINDGLFKNIPGEYYDEVSLNFSANYIYENLKEKSSYHYTYPVITTSGEYLYYQAKFAMINVKNKHRFILGLKNNDIEYRQEQKVMLEMKDNLQTIEEQKKVLEEQQVLLESANNAKSVFLFNMSHDIRTPMNAIIGYTNLAQKYIDDKSKVNDYLGKVDVAGQHLLTLINEVLDMSRIEAGKLRKTESVVNVPEACDALMSICQQNAVSRNIKLTYIDKGINNKFILADEIHVNRILLNIIGNAVKYTRPGGNVIFSAREIPTENVGKAKYIFTVEDTGIGMTKEFLEHIFESFSRAENKEVDKIQGTGLGMSIVKSLVDFLGGTINIESELNVGTTVTVTFEFDITEEPQKIIEITRMENILKGKRVLLVDDNDMNREIATEILEEEHIIVETAINGQVAVDMIKDKSNDYYDFVLMDIQMPVMNGYEATKLIREFAPKETLPIIALSANAFEEDRLKSIEMGMNEHVSKPINIPDLIGAISKIVQKD